jgi:hypothetical protein
MTDVARNLAKYGTCIPLRNAVCGGFERNTFRRSVTGGSIQPVLHTDQVVTQDHPAPATTAGQANSMCSGTHPEQDKRYPSKNCISARWAYLVSTYGNSDPRSVRDTPGPESACTCQQNRSARTREEGMRHPRERKSRLSAQSQQVILGLFCGCVLVRPSPRTICNT